jgi:hypothetical protein
MPPTSRTGHTDRWRSPVPSDGRVACHLRSLADDLEAIADVLDFTPSDQERRLVRMRPRDLGGPSRSTPNPTRPPSLDEVVTSLIERQPHRSPSATRQPVAASQ